MRDPLVRGAAGYEPFCFAGAAERCLLGYGDEWLLFKERKAGPRSKARCDSWYLVTGCIGGRGIGMIDYGAFGWSWVLFLIVASVQILYGWYSSIMGGGLQYLYFYLITASLDRGAGRPDE